MPIRRGLVQMLAKGHYGVKLDAESWDRLVTWIDLNAPAHGTGPRSPAQERVARQQTAAARTACPLHGTESTTRKPFLRPITPPSGRSADLWFRQVANLPETRQIGNLPHAGPNHASCFASPRNRDSARLAVYGGGGPAAAGGGRRCLAFPSARPGHRVELVRIPAGQFIMGQADGLADERPPGKVSIDRSYWMGRLEITNEQFALFDPEHQSGLEYGDYIQFSPGERGWTLSRAKQPVVRVSWLRALAFCRWLSAKTGRRFDLPSEAQWEYACRAGTATPLWYGTTDSDFSLVANLSDATHQAIDPFGWSGRPEVIPPWRPADTRFNDHARVSAPVGTYAPNAWGLYDMHGNVAEWTRSAYRPYPYNENDGRNDGEPHGKKVVRGGSWYDRPERCRSAFRQAYRAEQGVYDVGFRVICAAP